MIEALDPPLDDTVVFILLLLRIGTELALSFLNILILIYRCDQRMKGKLLFTLALVVVTSFRRIKNTCVVIQFKIFFLRRYIKPSFLMT